jgi:DNA-binding protein YbaB
MDRSRRAEYTALAELACQVRDEMDSLEAVADSADGLVRATVGGRGELLALDLDPRIFRDPDSLALSEKILETVQAANERAHRRMVRLAKRLLPGADAETLDPRFDPFLRLVEKGPDGSGSPWPR